MGREKSARTADARPGFARPPATVRMLRGSGAARWLVDRPAPCVILTLPLDAARLDIIHPALWGRAEGVRTVLRMLAHNP